MTRATLTPLEALRRLVAVAKWPDAHWFSSADDWNTFQGELGVAEGVLRDYVEPKPVGHVTQYFNGTASVHGAAMLALPHGAPLYAAPVTQPARSELGDEVIAALDAMDIGCNVKSWIGWQNGDGEEIGTRLQAAIDAYKDAAPAIAAPTEVERDAALICTISNLKIWASTKSTSAPTQYLIDRAEVIAAIATGEKHE